ncbi:hypothetical protein [Sphingobacterium sp.]|uniref:hypothetical protein n=1 Tax=Sphingobacterium sp. TaxID=341027 RepID=UPI00289E32BA|nr:hypothetical protein [Sphingobacterium sp.]
MSLRSESENRWELLGIALLSVKWPRSPKYKQPVGKAGFRNGGTVAGDFDDEKKMSFLILREMVKTVCT